MPFWDIPPSASSSTTPQSGMTDTPQQNSQGWTILGQIATSLGTTAVNDLLGNNPSNNSGSGASDTSNGGTQATRQPDWGLIAAGVAGVILLFTLIVVFTKKKKSKA